MHNARPSVHQQNELEQRTREYWKLRRGWSGHTNLGMTVGDLITSVNQLFGFAANRAGAQSLINASADLNHNVIMGYRKPRKRSSKKNNVVVIDSLSTLSRSLFHHASKEA